MLRALAALGFSVAISWSAAAMVGGAQPAGDAGRAVVLIVGSHGTSCSGVALKPDLILTAAHCALPGSDYKLVEFDAARQPALKEVSAVARHPEFKLETLLGHRATADLALLKLAAPLKLAPAALAPAGGSVAPGDRLVVIGTGLAKPGDGRSGGLARMATLMATGQPGTLQIRLVDPATKGERAGLGACTGDSGAPVFRETGGALAVIGVVSWSTGPNNSAGCGGLTGVTPVTRYRDWVVGEAHKLGAAIAP
jgi:secreted trypsin-like serine protease